MGGEREGEKGNIFEHCTLIMRRKEKKQKPKPKRESFEMRNVDESRLSFVFVANFRGCASDVGGRGQRCFELCARCI